MIRVVLIAAVLGMFGCSPLLVNNGVEMYQKYWDRDVSSLQDIASFHLACPVSGLTFKLQRRSGKYASQILVEGCKHSALYRRRAYRRMVFSKLTEWELLGSQ